MVKPESEINDPDNLRKKLDIAREEAREMGCQTLDVLKNGFYMTSKGKRVEIREMIRKGVNGTITYRPVDELLTVNAGLHKTRVEIKNRTTLSAVKNLITEGFKPVALNMASAVSAGGGFLSGARAQEEYLARSSSLYACLKNNEMYGRINFRHNPFYDDYVIYSPDVLVFRDDDGTFLDTPFTSAIITSPAVNANAVEKYCPQRLKEIADVMHRRIGKVFSVAARHNHTAIVLGAWGCGAFGNDGEQIARLFREVIIEEFQGVFERVVFAITDWSADSRFIGPFIKAFRIN